MVFGAPDQVRQLLVRVLDRPHHRCGKGRWAVEPELRVSGQDVSAAPARGHGGAATVAAAVASAKITVSADHVRGLTVEQISSLVNQQARRREIDPRSAPRGRGCSCRRSGPCGTRRSS